MLSDRRQIVLKLLINEYIAQGLPVGSRTLIDRYKLDISSATVRNELSYLEDAGYLTSPHTSAGRVPTDFGYRTFVDDLLEHLPQTPNAEILNTLHAQATELDNLLDKTSETLAKFTNCLAMVVPNALMDISVARITLVQLSDTQILAVIITEDGSVFKRPIETGEKINSERLNNIEQTLNNLYAGTIIASHSSSSENAEENKRKIEAIGQMRNDPLLLLVEQEILKCCANGHNTKAHTLGISHLLDQPEFSDASRLSPLVEKLEDETILFHLFNNAAKDGLPFIRIGHENATDELSEISVVATPYTAGAKQGMIAVIGPTRMNYEQVIKAVRAARTFLQDS